MSELPVHEPPPQDADLPLAAEARKRGGIATALVLAGLVVLPLAYTSGAPGLWTIAVCVPALGLLFGSAARRALVIRRALPKPCRSVLAVGWTRTPDGCNYAVFPPGAAPARIEPTLVIRLTLVRATTTTHALLVGSTRPHRSAALVSPDGDLVGVGRVLRSSRARKVWAGRHRSTPRWVMDPGRNSPPSA